MLDRQGLNRARQRGLSIVELMVGVTIGLLVVAAATVVMSGQLVENRRLLVEAQIQQDLRAASDLITRDLRRSAYLAEVNVPLGGAAGTTYDSAPSSLDTLDSVSATTTVGAAVPVAAVPNKLQDGFILSSSSNVQFGYVASTTGSVRPPFGYRLSGGVLKSRLAANSYDLTDANTMNVTAFDMSVSQPTSERLPCPKLCTGNTTDCWPTLQIRTVTFTIKAEGRGINSNIKRQITSTVRLRNDNVLFAAPPLVTGGTALACPA